MEQSYSENKKPMRLPREEILFFPRNGDEFDQYPSPQQPQTFKAWFEREGYILVRNAVSEKLCQAGVEAFQQEVLQDRKGFFERHASGKYERHVITEAGFMKYPIMNLQDLAGQKYPKFKKAGLDLLTQKNIQSAISILFDEPGRMVHTMYFDGNQTTWAHRDGHYIDSQQEGSMIGVWIAGEDIHPDAGRFYILPRSHRSAVPGELCDPNSTDYKNRMAEFVRDGPLDCIAPLLRAGDMLMWNSLIIHGSLPTADLRYSRRSFTAHYVPASHKFQWNVREAASKRSTIVNNTEVILHRDDATWLRQLRNAVRTHLPSLYGVAVAWKKKMSMD
jgi:phytanoyl-CoA hydroxylase